MQPANVELFSRVRYILTTGLAPFDDLIGGFPFGRISEIYGPEHCGKSALAIRASIRAHLKNIVEVVSDNGTRIVRPLDKKKVEVYVVHVDNEQSVDEYRNEVDGIEFHSLDIDTARIDTIEDINKLVDASVKATMSCQKERPDTLFFTVIVIDTLAATSSNDEMDRPWGDRDFDRRAYRVHELMRRMVRRINKANVLLLCTNQVRIKYDNARKNKFGVRILDDEYTSSGGSGLKYFSTHRVFMWRLPSRYKMHPKAKFPDGELISFYSSKNRCGFAPFREGRLALLFGDKSGHGGGMSQEYSILETLIYLKFAECGGGARRTDSDSGSGREIVFKFSSNGVPIKTFGNATLTLDEADLARGKNKRVRDPRIEDRSQWLDFYRAHKQDLDNLYAAAVQWAAATNAPINSDDEEDDVDGRGQDND